jgi:hypothetical protein
MRFIWHGLRKFWPIRASEQLGTKPVSSSSFCRSDWLKLPAKLPIQQIHFFSQINHAFTWTRFCHPEHGSRIPFWNAITKLYSVVLKPTDITIIWQTGKKCENLTWQVKFTSDSSCLTSQYLDPNGLSDSSLFLPLTSHQHCPLRIKVTSLWVTGTNTCTVQAVNTAILQISGCVCVWKILIHAQLIVLGKYINYEARQTEVCFHSDTCKYFMHHVHLLIADVRMDRQSNA